MRGRAAVACIYESINKWYEVTKRLIRRGETTTTTPRRERKTQFARVTFIPKEPRLLLLLLLFSNATVRLSFFFFSFSFLLLSSFGPTLRCLWYFDQTLHLLLASCPRRRYTRFIRWLSLSLPFCLCQVESKSSASKGKDRKGKKKNSWNNRECNDDAGGVSFFSL